MSEVQTHIPEPLIFTDDAANKVAELITDEGNPNLKLRVFITGGGCSGFQYGFSFEEVVADDDTIIKKAAKLASNDEVSADDEDEQGGSGSMMVELLVDPMSFTYLVGAEIDYKDDIEGARFIIRNPNAQTTCGCGSSFSV